MQKCQIPKFLFDPFGATCLGYPSSSGWLHSKCSEPSLQTLPRYLIQNLWAEMQTIPAKMYLSWLLERYSNRYEPRSQGKYSLQLFWIYLACENPIFYINVNEPLVHKTSKYFTYSIDICDLSNLNMRFLKIEIAT